ncbi:MAG: hypothetical protein R3Y51_02110 [Rikenellaceae bacterium]
MKKLLILSLFVLIGGISCNTQEKEVVCEEHTLTGRQFPNEILSTYPSLSMVNDNLMITSSRTSPVFSLYEIGKDSLELISTYGTVGHAGNEYIFIRSVVSFGDTIVIHDGTRQGSKIFTLLYNSENQQFEELSIEKPIPSPDSRLGGENRIRKLENGEYVGMSICASDKIFGLYDKDLNFKRHFGEFKFIEGANDINIVNYMQGAFGSNKNNVVLALGRLPYIVMYAVEGDSIVKKWDDEVVPMVVKVDGVDIKFDKERSIGFFTQVGMSDDYIFALYYDKSLFESYETPISASNIVYVYNYDGQRVAKLTLTEAIFGSICPSRDGTKLYSTDAETSCIVEYDLSDLEFMKNRK